MRHYRSAASIPPTPAQNAISDPHQNRWADDLLGDNLFDTTIHLKRLEAVVEAYLADVKTSHGSVKYWQVSGP